MNDFPEQDYALIASYLEHQLSETEQRAFEQRLLSDPAFAAEVEWVRKLLVNYRYLRLQDTFAEIRAKAEAPVLEQPEAVVRPLWEHSWARSLLVAATLAVVVSVGYWTLRPAPTNDPIAQQGRPAPIDSSKTPTPLSPDDPTPDPAALAQAFAAESPQNVGTVPADVREGVAAYENNDPDKAIAALKKPDRPTAPVEPTFGVGADSTDGSKGVTTSKSTTTSQGTTVGAESPTTGQYRSLYLGLSQLKNGQPALALASLKRVSLPRLKPTAQWYEALCYVQLKQPDKARALLETITRQPDHPYLTEATALLETLNESSDQKP